MSSSERARFVCASTCYFPHPVWLSLSTVVFGIGVVGTAKRRSEMVPGGCENWKRLRSETHGSERR
jgi:hypothetical protein